jgi:hypothetical protein
MKLKTNGFSKTEIVVPFHRDKKNQKKTELGTRSTMNAQTFNQH